MNNNTARGVITLHTPFPVSRWKSQQCRAEAKEATCPSAPQRKRSPAEGGRARKRDEAPGAKQERLHRASLRRLKAEMEAESQQARAITQPLLDTEKGLVKDLERFLSQHRLTELRRRELMHKRWAERVWLPLQRGVEERASSRGPAALKSRQSSYSQYLHHCNTKGFVFLDACDLREYDPFLAHTKKPHFFKVKAQS